MKLKISIKSLMPLLALGTTAASQAAVGAYTSIYNWVDNGANDEFQQIIGNGSVDINFTGKDHNNNTQTMNWKGNGTASSNFGMLHSYADGTVTNTYYNESNNPFSKSDGTVDLNGSPKNITTLSFAGFNDEFQYGGSLQAGYKARYFFHIDGKNSGYNPEAVNVAAGMAFNVAGQASSSYFAFGNGTYNDNFVTQDYDINGITPQLLNVELSSQAQWNLNSTPDGLSFSGISDFSNTATLSDIEVVDANGHYVSGWTLTAASGHQYTTQQAVPEPATMIALVGGLTAILKKRKKR